MLFKDIVGQEKLKRQLVDMVKGGRISHAQLLLGKVGYGGLPLAIAYAQYISCQDKAEEDSCGKCSSCLKFAKLVHPDLHFSFPFNKNKTEKSASITSDNFIIEWREAVLGNPYLDLGEWQNKIDIDNKQAIINVEESRSIVKKLSLKPYESAYKFLIMWSADSMNVQAANKLLKMIEEPNGRTLIILLAEGEENLLKTILSRTQIIRVPPISAEAIEKELVQQDCEETQAQRLAKFADGDLLAAIDLFKSKEEDQQFFELFKQWMRVCYKADIQGMHKWVEDASSKKLGREGQKRFLSYALEAMREGMLMHYTQNKLQKFYGEEEGFMKNFAPFVHSENILDLMEMLNEAHYHISRNAYAKIVFMDMSMKFANLLRIKKRTFVS